MNNPYPKPNPNPNPNPKEDELSQATHAYQTAVKRIAACTAQLDAPIPERSEEEAAVGKPSLVRSVPLIRKAAGKDAAVAKWSPPGKAAYKFTYEFSCKR